MADRKIADRELLELDYRTGLHTFKEMSATHGISGPRIKQIADKEGWTRDLGARIRQTARAKLSAPPSPDKVRTEAEIVEQGSNKVVDMVLAHQRDAGRVRTLTMALFQELEIMTSAPMSLRDLQECLRLCKASQDIPNALLTKADASLGQALTLNNRAGVLKNLTDTLSKVVAIEREAFGIGDPAPPSAEESAGAFTDFATFKAKFMAAVAKHQ
jgi:hypothetical protein